MKKIIFMISLLLTFPVITSAHTTVSHSTPEKDEVVAEPIDEIVVEFAGEIEEQGTLTLVKDTEEIKLDSVTAESRQLTGAITTPLENGSYQLKWQTASKDGHILSGEIPFSVNIPVDEEEVQEETKQADPEKNEEIDLGEKELQVEENTEVTTEKETVKGNNTTISTVSVIVLVILLALGIWILLRKKR